MMMPRESDLATLAQTTISFSMVRHPFERLVSAYQDKVVQNRDWTMFPWTKFGKGITFPDFVKEVIASFDSGCRYRY